MWKFQYSILQTQQYPVSSVDTMIRKQESVMEWVLLNMGEEYHFQITYREVESVLYDSLQTCFPLYESDELSYFWEISCC
jgi:hypothetical protein